MSVTILALRYLEPDWAATQECIEKVESRNSKVEIHYVDRIPPGVGNMAEAINRGFTEISYQLSVISKYVWFVSNVTFSPDLLPRLIEAMDRTDYAAIHPAFNSDHLFCRPVTNNQQPITLLAPFIEFTAPIIRSEVFAEFPLDESLPYWGHDLDWGYRLWQAGHKIGVLQSDHSLLGHTYIRNANQLPLVTRQRHALRRASNASTRHRLAQKYGDNWRTLIFPQTQEEIDQWRAHH